MKRSSAILLCITLSGSLLLTACTPKTSAERHARQYVYAADDGFNPNFYVKKADSTRMMVPFFRQFHDMGVKDRAAGVSREETQQRVSQFRSEEFLKSIQSEEEFAGRTYNDSSTPSPKELKAMGDAISATYMDGYEGIK
ncbi:hypothetical protein BN1086_04944 [Citrobacter koseri]|uniref:Exc2 family lipoprotein n=1 Tax=Citrobacter koseri TaxID=545 RepID=A0A078LMW5_CITKO|nr:hypothetical protein BN1086_04853 [Citrobacter koseri]CDZ86692.1 hypothetical protein BN1086_04944 [Citrobacter koseri]